MQVPYNDNASPSQHEHITMPTQYLNRPKATPINDQSNTNKPTSPEHRQKNTRRRPVRYKCGKMPSQCQSTRSSIRFGAARALCWHCYCNQHYSDLGRAQIGAVLSWSRAGVVLHRYCACTRPEQQRAHSRLVLSWCVIGSWSDAQCTELVLSRHRTVVTPSHR